MPEHAGNPVFVSLKNDERAKLSLEYRPDLTLLRIVPSKSQRFQAAITVPFYDDLTDFNRTRYHIKHSTGLELVPIPQSDWDAIVARLKGVQP